MLVPNKFPTLQTTKKIAVIGEAPGADEEANGAPFVGASGRFLAALLSNAGMPKDACFLGNISQHRPPGNDFSKFDWNGMEVQGGLEKLRSDIDQFDPNIVVLLGNVPLKAAKDIGWPLGKKFRHSVANWRGSVFVCDDERSPFHGRKCISAYHPAYILRDYEALPLLQLDLKKAVRYGNDKTLIPVPLNVYIPQSIEQAENWVFMLRHQPNDLGTDIEGYWNNLRCISFSPNATDAYIIPFIRCNGTFYWLNEKDSLRAYLAMATLLEDKKVGKIWQNGLYDRFVLHYGYRVRSRNNTHDIMLRHWELNSELEKSLSIQVSIYTDRPFYKSDKKSQDDEEFFRYNGTDSAVTKEINDKVAGFLTAKSSKEHYAVNVALLNPLLYMELRGIKYDVTGAKVRRDILREQLFNAQGRLNAYTGHTLEWKSVDEIFTKARELMGFKRATITNWKELSENCKKEYKESGAVSRLQELVQAISPNHATMSEIEDLLEVSFNLGSNKQVCAYLYETLKLPIQMSNVRGEEPHPTADYEALLKLSRELTKESDPRLVIIQTAIEIRALETRQRMLGIGADRDGRIRCGYNIVGSNTGRITCYESPTGSGYNLQTIPNYTSKNEAPGGILGDRDLFVADQGCWFFQCDLSGADGWTVAAYSAMLGDETMLNDYKAGVSPFKVLTLILRGLGVPTNRDSLREAVKVIGKDDWDRFAMKRVQHGGSYLEGGLTISRNILKDSEGKLYLSVAECNKMKDYFYQRYPGVKKWQDWIARRLKDSRGVLHAASGQIRQFFGRPDEILTKAVAHEPQANTTYATNLAMYNLWTDVENRKHPENVSGESKGCTLRIEPLHQVHDALCGQFRVGDTAWATSKIKSYFNNELLIAGQKIVIPYEGGYGPSWGSLNEGKL